MDVDSNAIHQVDYDAERGKLSIRFESGARYVYVGVPGEVHRAFVMRTPRVAFSSSRSATAIRSIASTVSP